MDAVASQAARPESPRASTIERTASVQSVDFIKSQIDSALPRLRSELADTRAALSASMTEMRTDWHQQAVLIDDRLARVSNSTETAIAHLAAASEQSQRSAEKLSTERLAQVEQMVAAELDRLEAEAQERTQDLAQSTRSTAERVEKDARQRHEKTAYEISGIQTQLERTAAEHAKEFASLETGFARLGAQVRKTPSWPRSWANFSLL
jgi:hypothetical protein